MSFDLTYLGGAAARLSTWIDASYPSDLPPELVARRRIRKLVEEVGEAGAALCGAVGENPRKGVTHTFDDVKGELLDVAVTALGALEHLDGNRGGSGTGFANRLLMNPLLAGYITLSGDLLNDVGLCAAEYSRTQDGLHHPDLHPELHLSYRFSDLVIALGAVERAVAVASDLGRGINPTVERTLENIAVVALGVWEHLDGNRGRSGHALAEKLQFVLNRVGLTVEGAAS
ncbi:MazG-like family protein [Curtobacterium sp. MCBD17_040]|uniref:MazG-like family protein n=1 Tax=Curtobacterium sp. MCBD17_040 TaxID=2175674 RepID=UPI000DA7B072